MKHAAREDCPCCHDTLVPGLDTDRALICAFVGGVSFAHSGIEPNEALCAHHFRLFSEASAFVAFHLKRQS